MAWVSASSAADVVAASDVEQVWDALPRQRLPAFLLEGALLEAMVLAEVGAAGDLSVAPDPVL